MSFLINFGQWGGVYIRKGYTLRVCLGWVAFTWFPCDVDDIFDDWKQLRDVTPLNSGKEK